MARSMSRIRRKFYSVNRRTKRKMRVNKRWKSETPTVYFIKRNGLTFRKEFHSRISAARAIKGWRRRGGRIMASRSQI